MPASALLFAPQQELLVLERATFVYFSPSLSSPAAGASELKNPNRIRRSAVVTRSSGLTFLSCESWAGFVWKSYFIFLQHFASLFFINFVLSLFQIYFLIASIALNSIIHNVWLSVRRSRLAFWFSSRIYISFICEIHICAIADGSHRSSANRLLAGGCAISKEG